MQSAADTFEFASLSREDLQAILKQYNLALTIDEALTIQNTILKRPPTLAECILWSIQGSEHCSYKSSRKFLKQFPTVAPHVILGPKEDAGIVSVAVDHQGKRYGIVISHESHNHPSQIVPYEGAATGIGGNVRDVCCMGAEVIAVADGLRFGDVHRPKTLWIQTGVVAGIAGYGNPIGVPNIAGDIYYDAGYNDNCLVTVVTLGVVAEDAVIHSTVPKQAEDYVYILVGKPTDNSGFGGASFASMDMDETQEQQNKGAVQEPNAFLKRHLLKANYALFDWLKAQQLIDRVGFKDLGAGGIACASVELADSGGYGAEIYLDSVPVGMQGLHPAVILCSETQERFLWVVPQQLTDNVLKHYNQTFALPAVSAGAEARVIGKVRHDGQYVVYAAGEAIVNARASDVTRGLNYDRPCKPPHLSLIEPVLPEPEDYQAVLLQLLAHENIASRAPIFERYDKQVQGRTILEAGEADAGVLQPFNEEKYPPEIRATGVALSLDQCPRYNRIDPYWGAVNAVVEAARNVAAVGAIPLAITDCLCFGNPEKPEQLWEFSESVRGIVAACQAIRVKDHPDFALPVVSGNVSLYNESKTGAIPASPMISCLGAMPDVSKALSYHFKQPGSFILLIGERRDECGGSVYYDLYHHLGAHLPQPDLTQVGAEIHTVATAIQQELLLAAHDISEGGVAVALAEMSFENQVGVEVQTECALPVSRFLFSESGGFILEVNEAKLAAVKRLLQQAKIDFTIIGKTVARPYLTIQGVIDLPISKAYQAWSEGLRDKLL